MKQRAKVFIIYFPIILVTCQVLLNVLFFAWPKFYDANGFYLNWLFGTNALYVFFMLIFTFSFKFCAVSKAAAIAEALFAIFYLVVQEDGVYNVSFQIIVGVVALGVTFKNYIKKFPFCKMSLWAFLFSGIFTSKGDCKKGVERFERTLQNKVADFYDSK